VVRGDREAEVLLIRARYAGSDLKLSGSFQHDDQVRLEVLVLGGQLAGVHALVAVERHHLQVGVENGALTNLV